MVQAVAQAMVQARASFSVRLAGSGAYPAQTEHTMMESSRKHGAFDPRWARPLRPDVRPGVTAEAPALLDVATWEAEGGATAPRGEPNGGSLRSP